MIPLAERRLFLGTFGALVALSLVPIWFVAYHPLTDLGQHLAAVSVWHHLHDPQYDFERYYALRLGANPYWGHYLLLHLFAYPLGLELANRVVLSLYVAGLPLAVLALARQFGRSDWLALFAFPLVWTFCFAMGFLNFCLGMVAALFALALFDRFCARPSVRLGLCASALGASVFFFHLLPWCLYVPAALALALCHEGRGLRRLCARALVLAPPAALGAWVVKRGQGNFMGYGVGRMTFKHYSVSANLKQMYDWVWNGCTGREDELFAIVLGAAWLLLKLTGRLERFRLHAFRAEACFVVALAGYLVVPRSVLTPFYWWGLNIRFATFAVVFLALTVPGAIAGWRRFVLVPVLLVAVACVVDVFVHWRRANAFVLGYDEMARLPEPGTRVLTIVYPPYHEPSYRHDSVRFFYAMYQAQKGGYMPWDFDLGFPLVYKVRYPAPDWSRPELRWEQHARYYDYLLTFQPPAPPRLFGAHVGEVKLVASAGKWQLWQFPGPRDDTPPGPAYPFEWAYDPRWKPPAR